MSRAAVDAALGRAKTVGDGGPYLHIRADAARGEASAAYEHADPLPLRGTTVAVKEMIAVAGAPQGAGSAAVHLEGPSEQDARVIAELRRNGAVIIGTTTMHELAFGVTGVNAFAGTPVHPVDPSRIPGGSSSGSAVAVADGSATLGVGTDTGGSVRIPAALCGVAGFKPARDDIPLDGVLPLAPTLDHVGLLARGIGEIVTAYRTLGGRVSAARPQRLGVIRAELDAADSTVASAIEKAISRLRRAGISVDEINWPEAERISAVSTTIMFSEAAQTYASVLERDATLLQDDVRSRLERGSGIPAAEYRQAMLERADIIDQVNRMLAGVDAVIGPTVPMVAPHVERADDADLPGRLVANTRLANLTGLPAVSVPLSSGGLPVGLQVLGRGSEHVLGLCVSLMRQLSGRTNGQSRRTADRRQHR